MMEETDQFRPCFKYFKAKKPPPDFTSVIDFNNVTEIELNDKEYFNGNKVSRCILNEPSTSLPLGLKPVSQWKAYHLSKHPGFVVILDPFKPGFQRYWIKRCMQDYHLPPNVTNLDPHLDRSHTAHIFDDFVKKNRDELQKDDLLMKLRWATLGYHYDWTAKKYYPDRFTKFPWDLSKLSSCIAEATGHTNFVAEAGIVNYYHLDSTLAGHTDHSEFNKTAPLMSISFGQDAVFLLGGKTKSTPPTAMYLRSGDICVMGGESRMGYHAVPRILPSTCPTYQQDLESQEELTLSPSDLNCDCPHKCSHKLNQFVRDEMKVISWKPLSVFLKTSRINVNIRQVLNPGEPFPRVTTEDTTIDSLTHTDVPSAKKSKLDDS